MPSFGAAVGISCSAECWWFRTSRSLFAKSAGWLMNPPRPPGNTAAPVPRIFASPSPPRCANWPAASAPTPGMIRHGAPLQGGDIEFVPAQPDDVVPEEEVKVRALLHRVQHLSRRLAEPRTDHETDYRCSDTARAIVLLEVGAALWGWLCLASPVDKRDMPRSTDCLNPGFCREPLLRNQVDGAFPT
jgi:hypothetical protein